MKQRALAKDVIGDNMTAEMGAFSFRRDGGGEAIKEVPFVYVPNLIRKATDLIEEHRRYRPRALNVYYFILDHSLEHQQNLRGMKSFQRRRFGLS